MKKAGQIMANVIEKYAEFYTILRGNPTIQLCSAENRGGYLNRASRLRAYNKDTILKQETETVKK